MTEEPTGLPIPDKKPARKKRKTVKTGRKPTKDHDLTNRVLTCLWKGEDLPSYSNDQYDLRYVERLLVGVQRHVPRGTLTVIADDHYGNQIADDPALKEVRLERLQGHGIGGWSNMLEICRPNLRPIGDHRHMLVGLDTVFMGDCQWLFDWNASPVGLPRDPYKPHIPCDAVWTFNREGAEQVWDAYLACKDDGMKDYLLFGKPSEMVLLRYLFRSFGWQYLEPRPIKLLSYKAHVLRGANPWKQKASIAYFHGKPKPHELPDNNKIKQEWLR